ncbi:hypothetical protein ACAG25_23250 [Mycobacterium sp. pV006]|uniref:hypothetical protein n=1 Tax=Mycobacterium sp. pV006 TaxID=3238983 RepID=UPI00351B86BC
MSSLSWPPPLRLGADALVLAVVATITSATLTARVGRGLGALVSGLAAAVGSIGILSISIMQLAPTWTILYLVVLPLIAGSGVFAGSALGGGIRYHPNRRHR